MITRLTLLTTLLLAPLCLSAPDEPTERASVERLIAQLGSARFAEREAATRALDALGEPALEALRKARASSDAEIRRRAEELVAVLEHRVENARLLSAKRIRLVYKDANVLDVLADVTRKTGFPVEFEGDRSAVAQRALTLDTGEVSVWEALDQFMQAAGLMERLAPATVKNTSKILEVQNGVIIQGRINMNSGYTEARSPYDTRVVVVNGKQPRWPTHDAGSVRVRAIPIALASAETSLGRGEARVDLEVTPQPSLPWQGVLEVRVQHAVDEHGQKLTQVVNGVSAQSVANQLWARNGAVFIVDIDGMEPAFANRFHSVRLKGGTKPAKLLAEMSGVIAAQTEIGPEPLITVDNVFQAVGRTFTGADGALLKVLEAKREESGKILVRVELQTPLDMFGGVIVRGGRRPGRGFNGREIETAALPITLLDANGQRVQLGAVDAGQVVNPFGFPQQMTLTFEPKEGQAEAAKLVYSGKRTVVLDIPFTLKNVPLP